MAVTNFSCSFILQVTLSNYLLLGEGDRSHSHIVVDRIIRSTHRAANELVKPIYKPRYVRWVRVHSNFLRSGITIRADPEQIRMLHYWGSRGFESEDDRIKTLQNTVEMSLMREMWAKQIENSLLVFGELDSFSNSTGP